MIRPGSSVTLRSLTLRDLEDLGDERFEALVASLVMRRYPGADHLGAPDGGADVILEEPGRRPKVWQVKHYPRRVDWGKCEASLVAAHREYEPSEVVFVFPRKITRPLKKTFKRRLASKFEDVAVSHVSGPQVLEELSRDEDADLLAEFFGLDSAELASTVVDRVGAEFTLGPQDDQLELLAKAQHGARLDRRFDSEVTSIIGEVPEPVWTDPPYLVAVGGAENQQVRVASWAREEMELPTLRFTADDAGNTARSAARSQLARGQEVCLSDGVVLRLEVPEAARAAFPEGFTADLDRGVVRLKPPPGHRVRIEGSYDGADVVREFQAYSIPPPTPADTKEERVVSFGGAGHGFEFFLDLHLLCRPKVRAEFHMSLDSSAAQTEVADSARLLLSFIAGEATIQTELLPATDESPVPGPDITGDLVQRLETIVRLDRALRVIEEQLGVHIEPPDALQSKDIVLAIQVADALSGRGGTLQLTSLTGEVPTGTDPDFLERLSKPSMARYPLRLTVFGHALELGLAEGEIPSPDLVLPGDVLAEKRIYELRWNSPVEFKFALADGGPTTDPDTPSDEGPI